MMGTLRFNAHLFQHQADLPADIFTFIIRRDIHIPRPVIRNGGRLSFIIQFKKVKFLFRPKPKNISGFLRVFNGLFQEGPGITFKNPSIRISDS